MIYVPDGFPTKDGFCNDDFNRHFDSSRGGSLTRDQHIPENAGYKSREAFQDVGSVWDLDPSASIGPTGVRAWNDAPQHSLWSDAFEVGKRPTQLRPSNVREDIKIPKQAINHDWSNWKTVDTA